LDNLVESYTDRVEVILIAEMEERSRAAPAYLHQHGIGKAIQGINVVLDSRVEEDGSAGK
jgi:hypothetical protein